MSIEFGAKPIAGMGADLKRMRDAAKAMPRLQPGAEEQVTQAEIEAKQQEALARAFEQMRTRRMMNASSLEIVSFFRDGVISLNETRWFLGIGAKPETLE